MGRMGEDGDGDGDGRKGVPWLCCTEWREDLGTVGEVEGLVEDGAGKMVLGSVVDDGAWS